MSGGGLPHLQLCQEAAGVASKGRELDPQCRVVTAQRRQLCLQPGTKRKAARQRRRPLAARASGRLGVSARCGAGMHMAGSLPSWPRPSQMTLSTRGPPTPPDQTCIVATSASSTARRGWVCASRGVSLAWAEGGGARRTAECSAAFRGDHELGSKQDVALSCADTDTTRATLVSLLGEHRCELCRAGAERPAHLCRRGCGRPRDSSGLVPLAPIAEERRRGGRESPARSPHAHA